MIQQPGDPFCLRGSSFLTFPPRVSRCFLFVPRVFAPIRKRFRKRRFQVNCGRIVQTTIFAMLAKKGRTNCVFAYLHSISWSPFRGEGRCMMRARVIISCRSLIIFLKRTVYLFFYYLRHYGFFENFHTSEYKIAMSFHVF